MSSGGRHFVLGVRVATLAALLAITTLAFGPGSGFAQDGPADAPPACNEAEATEPAPDGATDLIELQDNALRPTFDVSLAGKTSGQEEISFTPKTGKQLSRSTDVAAEIINRPRLNTHPLRGALFIAAHPSESGRAVVVEMCLEGVRYWDAGRYQGTIMVYGPKLADFTYAVVVTSKWPWWIAVIIIGLVVVFSAMILLLVSPPTNGVSLGKKRSFLAPALGLVVGAGLAALGYWSSYVQNDTWGADPQADIVGLAMASFSATVVGYGSVKAALARLGSNGNNGS